MLEETAAVLVADLFTKEATLLFAQPLLPPPQTPLEELVTLAYQGMMTRGYGYHTIYEACRHWRQLMAYAAQHAVETFSPELAAEYLAACQRRPNVSPHFLSATNRALRVLDECQQRGTWDTRKKPASPFAAPRTPLETLVAHAYQAMVAGETGPSTIREVSRCWRQLLEYADSHAVERFSATFIDEYWVAFQQRPAVSRYFLRDTRHALRILQEFEQRGAWDRYPVRLKDPTPPFAAPRTPLESMMAQAYQAMEGLGYQQETLAATARRWLQYARFVEGHNEAMLSPTLVDAFLETYQEASPTMRELASRAMRALLDFHQYGYWRKYLLPRQETPLLFDSPRTPLEAVIAQAYQAMLAQGYSATTLATESRFWRHFVYYAESQGVDTLSSALVDAYLTCQREDLTVPLSHVQGSTRVLRRLLEFAECGAWRRFPARRQEATLTSATFAAARERFLQYWHTERQVARNTQQYGRRYTLQFLLYLEAAGVREWHDLSGPLIGRFISENPAWSSGARQVVVSTLRVFLRYLFVQGEIDRDWAGSLPTVRRGPKRKLPVIWTQDELTALFAAVERSSAIGKRDYAILLLASRLGMRASDIRALRLDDIHWEHARLDFLQEKTGKRIVLPLPGEVGDALIAYLRDGRPQSSHREVFLSHTSPRAPFAHENHLHGILNRYRQRAGIRKKPGQAQGLHSLRHTFATGLLGATVPIDTIASLLGHQSLESTRIYTQVDIPALRQVALDIEEVSNDR